MCAPHASRAADPVVVNVTVMSALLLLLVGPEWVGTLRLSIVPPYSVRLRLIPAKVSAPATVLPALVGAPGAKGSLLNVAVFAEGRLGHSDETAPPPEPHRFGLSVSFHVARKSYARWPPAVKSSLRWIVC